MVLKQMVASVCVWDVYRDQKSRTKPESKLREALLQLASRKTETH